MGLLLVFFLLGLAWFVFVGGLLSFFLFTQVGRIIALILLLTFFGFALAGGAHAEGPFAINPDLPRTCQDVHPRATWLLCEAARKARQKQSYRGVDCSDLWDDNRSRADNQWVVFGCLDGGGH
jgi:hypothetical protein